MDLFLYDLHHFSLDCDTDGDELLGRSDVDDGRNTASMPVFRFADDFDSSQDLVKMLAPTPGIEGSDVGSGA